MPGQTPGPGVSEQQRLLVIGALVDHHLDGGVYVRSRDLAEPTGLDSRSVGRVLWHLEREGLVEPWSGATGSVSVWRLSGPLALEVP